MIFNLAIQLLQRLGWRAAGALLIGAGIVQILPIVFPAYIVQGIAYLGAGLALLAFGSKFQSAQKQFIQSEAEKRIQNRELPNASSVPAIQREINKQQGTEPDDRP